MTLKPDASVVVASDMTDIGTGSYTIMAQTAAQRGDCRGNPPASRSACGSRGARADHRARLCIDWRDPVAHWRVTILTAEITHIEWRPS
ncbi:hypothetical protein ACQZ5G_19525 [Agrobacterium sp. 22-214-1]